MRLSELSAGQVIQADSGFTCMRAGPKTVQEDEDGLFVWCHGSLEEEGDRIPTEEGIERHYLDGQVEDESDEVIGFSWPSEP